MRQLWVAPFRSVHTADGAALANSTTLTRISPTPDVVVPANFWEPGMAINVKARGRFSTTGTPTLNLGVYIGNVATAIATTGAITTTSGVTTVPWELEADVICRTDGSTGTVFGMGWVRGISGTVGVSSVPLPASAPTTATWDTTAASALTVGATWGTANASNTITCHQLIVTVIG